MDIGDKSNATVNTEEGSGRLLQLLQVWRDYYDEIFEVNLNNGSFVSLMDHHKSFWTTSGFAGIEVIVMAEKRVHPDDKEAFSEFFDLDKIAACINQGIYVSKLNFRLRGEEGEYFWVKVKNIVPTILGEGDIRFFSCFRRVDAETDSDLKYKQELSDALNQERKLNEKKNALINQILSEIRNPLNGIIGMTRIAKDDPDLNEVNLERIIRIEEEARKMNRVVRLLTEAEELENTPEIEILDHSVNKINYGRRKSLEEPKKEESTSQANTLPEDYGVYTSDNADEGSTDAAKFDFSGRRFLIAEDNRLSADVMIELFRATGAQADSAADGKQAVISFVSKPAGTYDAVLMDIDMPVLDGYSATKCIRLAGKDDSESIPVIAVTSNSQKSDVYKTYEYGFNVFFSKPVNFAVLFDYIQKNICKE